MFTGSPTQMSNPSLPLNLHNMHYLMSQIRQKYNLPMLHVGTMGDRMWGDGGGNVKCVNCICFFSIYRTV